VSYVDLRISLSIIAGVDRYEVGRFAVNPRSPKSS
jgi:hypothetical protein